MIGRTALLVFLWARAYLTALSISQVADCTLSRRPYLSRPTRRIVPSLRWVRSIAASPGCPKRATLRCWRFPEFEVPHPPPAFPRWFSGHPPRSSSDCELFSSRPPVRTLRRSDQVCDGPNSQLPVYALWMLEACIRRPVFGDEGDAMETFIKCGGLDQVWNGYTIF